MYFWIGCINIDTCSLKVLALLKLNFPQLCLQLKSKMYSISNQSLVGHSSSETSLNFSTVLSQAWTQTNILIVIKLEIFIKR